MGLLLKSLSRLDARPLQPANESELPPSVPAQKAVAPTSPTPPEQPAAQEPPSPAQDGPAYISQLEEELPVIREWPGFVAAESTTIAPPPAISNLPAQTDSALPQESSSLGSTPQQPAPSYVQHFSDLPLAAESTVEFGSDWSTASESDWQRLEDLQNQVMADLENLTASDFDITEVNLTEIEPPQPASAVVPTTWPGGIPAPASATALPEIALASSAIEPALSAITSALPAIAQPLPGLITSPQAAPSAALAALNLRPEYRELRDQLLARLDLTQHPMLGLISVGQEAIDAAWLWPLAAGIVDKLNVTRSSANSRILLVEAATDCGLAHALGLETCLGLNHVLNGRCDWQQAVQATQHPQIKLLCPGREQIASPSPQQLKTLWAELSPQFDLLLLVMGSINLPDRSTAASAPTDRSADLLLPLTSAAVLYVELGSTSATSAEQTKRLLDAKGIKLLGCIVQPN